MASMKEQMEQYKRWKEDPINNPKPESLKAGERMMADPRRRMGFGGEEEPEPYLPSVPSRSKPLSIITSSDSTNGKVLEKYCWSQDLEDIVVRIPVPEDIRKGADVHVQIKKRFLEVWLKRDNVDSPPIINQYLWKDIDVSESHWTLVPGEAIDITLAKTEPRLWDALTPDDDEPLDLGKTEFYRNLRPAMPPPDAQGGQ